MVRSLPVENLLPQNVGLINNYLQQCTEAAQWGTHSCSQPQPATDNGVRDGRSNWLVAPPPLSAVPPELLVHSINQCNLSGNRTCNRSMRGSGFTHVYKATQGLHTFTRPLRVYTCLQGHSGFTHIYKPTHPRPLRVYTRLHPIISSYTTDIIIILSPFSDCWP